MFLKPTYYGNKILGAKPSYEEINSNNHLKPNYEELTGDIKTPNYRKRKESTLEKNTKKSRDNDDIPSRSNIKSLK